MNRTSLVGMRVSRCDAPVAALVAALATLGFLLGGCAASDGAWLGLFNASESNTRSPYTKPDADDAIAVNLRPQQQKTDELSEAERVRLRQVPFNLMLVRVPQQERAQVAPIWNYVRDDTIPSDRRLQLKQNGIRVGVGSMQWWEPVEAAIDAIDGAFSNEPQRWTLPQGYPLNLRLDDEPHEQTLFAIDDDGRLTGGTWAASISGLQLSYMIDPVNPQQAQVSVVPVVLQDQRGYRYIRTAGGLPRVLDATGRVFVESGLQLDMGPGEFLVIAPHETADVAGLLGTQLLTMRDEGLAYDYYVFVRPELSYAAARD
jgi:hypothetical protein